MTTVSEGENSQEVGSLMSREVRSVYLSVQKFGFINGVDNVNWPPYRDSKS